MLVFQEKIGVTEFQKWKERCLDIINQSYPNPLERQKYRLWHALIGGTTGYGDVPNFDFPGECSIQQMIEKLP
ncbi:hypothetical protein A3A95_04005 [Candidatus Nomurabacteria bacterium RIFCSPLOWO2_01_FULL_39_18]|uniref:Uncharacterized protein n=1 Tax=Candidatus Nomurabacteria bacterium RIFCSPHIGHO2_01_FULL_40_24b TaxID=1801739 RepID=A0A1F6V614_9BACT|nr:MAG: hypothetical protein A2647_04515 [Candidatus Nomurabacteria bacterium RIFCSPHIGHO2_01_FULL_40_24b]OGI89267.1 MAG: hypothetical protein A3A95_04005 [Candidatus Nomurabacteria bacterium RIFCSPLOWO2_01_FULL_39_18]